MKKQLIVLAVCLVVAAVMCLSVSLPGRSGTEEISQATSSLPIAPTTKDPQKPEVRLYICDNEELEIYEALARQYTTETGVSCKILTGNLEELMKARVEPTIFGVHSQEELLRWQNDLYDLSGTPVLEQLCNPAFALTLEDQTLALGMNIQAYGVIYNAELLGLTGYTREDITDFDTLAQVVEAATEKGKSMGFTAFTLPTFNSVDFVSMLLYSGMDSGDLRAFCDLMLANASLDTGVDAFIQGEAVFYVGSSWEYETISQLDFNKLDILPFFSSDGGSLPCICDTYWAINKEISDVDLQATLDFLLWLVTEDEGVVPVDSLELVAPFRDAVGGDLFTKRLVRKYIATEPVTVRWVLTPGKDHNAMLQLSQALQNYANAPTNENWRKIEALMG